MEVIFTRPNFLASERNLVLQTVGLDAVTNKTQLTVENGRNIIKAGTVLATGKVKGIVYQDVDLTGSTATTQVPVPVMTAGYYYNDTKALSEKITASTPAGFTLTNATAQGLFERERPAVTRP